jgi:hypothetical protein
VQPLRPRSTCRWQAGNSRPRAMLI